jgi:multiple sugar transport system substrate-binding protein
MKRQITSFIVIAAFIAAFVVPLAAHKGAAQDEVVISIVSMDQAGMTPDELDEIATRFEEANPGIKVETNYVSYEGLHDLLVTSVSSSPPAFDIFLMDDIWFAEFADAGWLLDITDRITPDMRAGIFESAWPVTTVDDVVYGMPWLLDTKYFFYNTRILQEAGFDAPPTTWEELAEQSRVIKEKGLAEYPTIWSWAQAEAIICDFVTLLYGNGGQFFDENNEPVFNSEQGVQVVQWMVDMVDEGLANPSSITSLEGDVVNVFAQGNAAFTVNWLFAYAQSQSSEDSLVVDEVGMAPMPVFQAGADQGIVSSSINGSMGFALAAGTEHPDEAWAFLKYLSSEPIQIEYSTNQLPIWTASFEKPELVDVNPVTVPMFAAQFPYANVRPKVPYYNEMSRIIQIALQQALTGEKSPQEALDDAVAQVKDVQSMYE